MLVCIINDNIVHITQNLLYIIKIRLNPNNHEFYIIKVERQKN